jgi:hypothetical protein
MPSPRPAFAAAVILLGACAHGATDASAPSGSASSVADGLPPSASVAPSTSASAPPPERNCLPVAASGGVAHFEATPTELTVCYLVDDTYPAVAPCLRVALDTGAISAAPAYLPPTDEPPPPVVSPSPFTLTTTGNTVTVCKTGSTDCKTIKAGGTPLQEDSMVAALNDDGSRVFVIVADLLPGQPEDLLMSWRMYGDVYDTKTAKRTSRTLLTNIFGKEMLVFADKSNSHHAYWVGSNVVLGDHSCCGPGGVTFLLDPAAHKAMFLHPFQGSEMPIDGKTWLVFNGNRGSVVAMDKMKELSTFVVPGALGDPDQVEALAARAGSTFVIPYAAPPGWMTFDPTTHATGAPHPLPICPP